MSPVIIFRFRSSKRQHVISVVRSPEENKISAPYVLNTFPVNASHIRIERAAQVKNVIDTELKTEHIKGFAA